MARKQQRRRFSRRRGTVRRSGKKNIAIGPILGLAGGLALPALDAWDQYSGTPTLARVRVTLDQVGQSVYGYSVENQKWYTGNLPRFWAPMAGGIVAHKVANWTGLNASLRAMKLGITI